MPRKAHVVPVLVMLLALSLAAPTTSTTTPGNPGGDFGDPVRIYGEDISRSIFQGVSQSRYLGFIQKLTENGSRSTSAGNPPFFSTANFHARNWIAEQLESLSRGRIEVEILGDHKSVVGRLPGYLQDEAPVLMVGGHYDSVPDAPGANDDATGVAAALELARVMSRYEWPLDVYFCAWNSEEIGLIGSAEVADIFRSRGIDILTYWNVDMLLVQDDTAPADERVLMVHNDETMKFAHVARAMSNNYGMNLVTPLMKDQFSAWSRSDHASFLARGYEKVLFAFESGLPRDSAYHTAEDTWDNPLYNYTIARDAVASIGASMAYTMARAQNQMHSVKYFGYLQSTTHRTYYIPISTNTQFVLNGGWSGSGMEIELVSPHGEVIFSFLNQQEKSEGGMIANVSLGTIGLHKLIISGNESAEASYNLELVYDGDLDNDGIKDSTQFWLDPELFNTDQDSDGLSDALEIIIGTSIDDEDSDADGMPDLWEYENDLDASLANAQRDSDGDSLSNIDEYRNGTNPQEPDTDFDGMPDGWEVVNGTDPLIDDSMLDPDEDDLPNIHEYGNRTYPNDPDSDGDSMSDSWEITNGLNPLKDDADSDPDNDGLTNLGEYQAGTNPMEMDSDSDGMPDNWEIIYSLNPNEDDAHGDADGDGVSNIDEFLLGGDPRLPYTTLPVIGAILAVSFLIISIWIATRWALKNNNAI